MSWRSSLLIHPNELNFPYVFRPLLRGTLLYPDFQIYFHLKQFIFFHLEFGLCFNEEIIFMRLVTSRNPNWVNGFSKFSTTKSFYLWDKRTWASRTNHPVIAKLRNSKEARELKWPNYIHIIASQFYEIMIGERKVNLDAQQRDAGAKKRSVTCCLVRSSELFFIILCAIMPRQSLVCIYLKCNQVKFLRKLRLRWRGRTKVRMELKKNVHAATEYTIHSYFLPFVSVFLQFTYCNKMLKSLIFQLWLLLKQDNLLTEAVKKHNGRHWKKIGDWMYQCYSWFNSWKKITVGLMDNQQVASVYSTEFILKPGYWEINRNTLKFPIC